MKKLQVFSLLAIPVVLLTGFKKSIAPINLHSAAIDISIGNTSVVEGSSGQRTVEVALILSEATNTPVSVSYSTKNGTATAGADFVTTSGTISFAPGERMKKIPIVVKDDNACEGDETFEIVLSNATGASISVGTGTVTILNDDCLSSNASGGINNPMPAIYEIRLTFTGYTTFSTGPPDCPIREKGKVVLSGLVSGKEQVDFADDIMYRGKLHLDIDIDICSVKRLANGEDRLCGMTVIGSGTVDVELEVQFDARGGYIQLENKSGNFLRAVFGKCDAAEMSEEQTMVSNRTIASIFNGYELPDLTNRTLTVGRYVMTGELGETVVEVLRKIR